MPQPMLATPQVVSPFAPATPPSPPLVGLDWPDDAAVTAWPGSREAMVLTCDFFTPIVDDPETFGAIAAINALSDVYAMGGVPRYALAIAAFPTKTLPMAVLGSILAGGARAAAKDGVPVLGGHTIDDAEPKYGLSVVGAVDPMLIWRKRGLRDGDALVLTKAIGTGVISTAFKRDAIDERSEPMRAAVASMTTSNARAAEIGRASEVHAATDVTGYGLLGHLGEMLGELRDDTLGIDAEIDVRAVPLLAGALDLAKRGLLPGGSTANAAFVQPRVSIDDGLDPARVALLSDAQTSGGLLLAMTPSDASRYVASFGAPSAIIGRCVRGSGRIRLKG
jgi:selenide,water dikinase